MLGVAKKKKKEFDKKKNYYCESLLTSSFVSKLCEYHYPSKQQSSIWVECVVCVVHTQRCMLPLSYLGM